MAMVEKKHRPSLTSSEVKLITKWLDNGIRTAVQHSNTVNHSEIAGLVKIKEYLASFVRNDDVNALIALYSQPQPVTGNPAPINPTDTLEDFPIQTKRASPLDNKDLSDTDILEILSLLHESERTEEENKWYLNTGTAVRLKQMMAKGVKSTDL